MMKKLLLSLALITTGQVFAAKTVSLDCGPKMTNIIQKTIVDKEGTGNCGVEDIDCGSEVYIEATYKDVVLVEVSCEDKMDHIDDVVYPGASFKMELDASLFSHEELKLLSAADYQKRMKAAKDLLELDLEETFDKNFSSSKVLKVDVLKK